MKKFTIKSLGCKANYSDGQHLEVGLMREGHVATDDLETADFVIVNSCTVTDEADKQSRKMAKEIFKKNPRAKIIYTGCGAEVHPELALQSPGVAAVIGNQNKGQAAKLITEFLGKESTTPEVLGTVRTYEAFSSKHPMDREWAIPSSGMDEILELEEKNSTFRTRSFIKIQEGCDSFCTYCIIPYGRGPNRSLPISEILPKVQALADSGIQEVVLTGTNIGDYGMDWAKKLMIDDLIEGILTKTSIPRLRVSSLDPTEISERMIELMESHESFCPHFHVSLQHTESKVLRLMKRKYNESDVTACLNRLSQMRRKPFVGMDFITGFPGESEVDFNASVERLKALYWSRLHVFPYSERSGTPATRLPHVVPDSTRKGRAKTLQALSLERLTSLYAKSRQSLESDQALFLKGVLLEGAVRGPDGSRNWISGYAPNYERVVLPLLDRDSSALRNQIQDVHVKHWVVDRASGEVSWIGEFLS